MSDKKTSQASQRKPSTNNIKKLRTISTVCSLTQSWQQWVKENETKQASEPSGWAPSWIDEPAREPKKPWATKAALSAKKTPPQQSQPTEVTQKTSSPHKETETEGEDKTSAGLIVESRIKTKQVVKTVTSKAQEKSAGIGLLTERITKEALPSSEEIDRMLNKRSSPTRRRKCSNMVSSLTKSWKEVEKEQKPAKQGGGPQEGHIHGVNERDCGYPEAKGEKLDTESGQTHSINSLKDTEQKEGHSESIMMIKRPPVSKYKKEAEDANKINAFSKKYSAVGNLKSRWQSWASEHNITQKLNPFSDYFDYDYSMSLRLQKGQDGYGRPKEGSKTAERAKRAEQHIHQEIDDLCFVIRTMADPDPDRKTRVTFGQLFDRYVRISDKVVGILMRARKHGKVAFEGEMLWQGQDDAVIITLLE
ncbi:hypothetical protein LDENG_00148420 [Lucifuga dentata]|nr:hypothetical protein LDENG_00148420 [Lucifuga dentata]